ncbi:hypothetical protein B0I35DRAFT_382213 [Stachybotrys elegans]|uniref:RRM domain-containing protein n=1 Tax=Stachybotrys elegans TaxID=80388 RepID=A0A8K0SIZ3_9HYPO|nr:hypothetical protein B0I35DRAFT_382213 [Stachybotrys elegans]
MVKSKRARDAVEAEEQPVAERIDDKPSKKRKTDDADTDVKEKKKSKKDKHKKESRKEKKEKRKDIQDLPDDDAVEDMNIDKEAGEKPEAADSDAEVKKEKKEKKKKEKEEKKKKEKEEKKKDKKEKKDKKDKKSKKEKKDKDNADGSKDEDDEPMTNGDAEAAEEGEDAEASGEKRDRHIVFVGNLPFTATAETIKAHFASLSPISVRCMKNPNDDKPCRGIAFVEFGKVWHQRTCLDKFHHSLFDDGVSPARKINVELTAGGGGKSKHRQEKILEKNKKLNENRTKRIHKEQNAKEEAKKASARKEQMEQKQDVEDSIHPSRRGRVPGYNR